MKRFFYNIGLLLVFIIMPVAQIMANEEVYINSLRGTDLAQNATLKMNDPWYGYMVSHPLWEDEFSIADAKCRIILRFDNSSKVYHADYFKLVVSYSVNVYDDKDYLGTYSTHTGNLTIDYAPDNNDVNSYIDKSIDQYVGGFRAELTVTSVNFYDINDDLISMTMPEDMFLDVETSIERHFMFDDEETSACTTANGFVPSAPVDNILPVTWSYIEGAVSYDFEWVFVDIPGTPPFSDKPFDFKNATRINTTNNYYNISLTYPSGTILYRVRPVGVEYENPATRIEGTWNIDQIGTTETYTIYPADRYDYSGLDENYNWGYSASYTEDGKRSEAISYMDGALLNRQAVVINNSKDKVLINETKYDYQGRPAIVLLPVPAENSGLHFYGNINSDFTRNSFDEDATIGDAMATSQTSSYTSWYYSEHNTDNTGINGYLPDAEGYPYIQTRYMPDGSGRVYSQSEVGEDHQLGSGHEVMYYYGSPSSQTELDRLFGNEVGPVVNYQKTAVKDANGQYSVSYLDNAGRVIATALSGEAPDNLDPIDNQPDAEFITGSLAQVDQPGTNGDVVSSSTFIVITTGEYDFNYSLTDLIYDGECIVDNNCSYDLEFHLYEDDGEIVSDFGTLGSIIYNDITDASVSFSYTFTIPGTYSITKILRIHPSAQTGIFQTFIDDQECYPYQQPTANECDFSCTTLCAEMYDPESQDYLDCIADCQNPEIADDCSIRYMAMQADMSPGGQYFDDYEKDEDLTSFEPSNIWFAANVWADNAAEWATADLRYPDDQGTLITNWQDLRDHWNPEFLTELFDDPVPPPSCSLCDCNDPDYHCKNSLIEYHPEYCAYEYHCLNSCSTATMPLSNDYDREMMLITETSDAVTTGYYNPLGLGIDDENDCDDDNTAYQTTENTSNLDPYYTCDWVEFCPTDGTPYDLMQNFLTHFQKFSTTGSYFSIWYLLDDPDDIANNSCSGIDANVQILFETLHKGYNGNLKLIEDNASLRQPGQVSKYQFFRSTYLYYKNLILQKGFPLYVGRWCGQFDLFYLSAYDYQVRFPKDPFFDNLYPDGCDLTDADAISASIIDFMENEFETTTLPAAYANNCESQSAVWMNQLADCIANANGGQGLPSADITAMQGYLVDLCTAGSDYDNMWGTNNIYPSTIPGPGTTTFSSFDEIVDYYVTNGSCPHIIPFN